MLLKDSVATLKVAVSAVIRFDFDSFDSIWLKGFRLLLSLAVSAPLAFPGGLTMKLPILASLTLLPTLLWAMPLQASDPADLQQLLETRACAGCDLQDADLSQQHLIGADLRGADLRGADLTGINLEGADLTGANLEGADLTEAYLTNASLNDANLNGINLTRAKIYHADVSGAAMQELNLTDAEIYGTGISVGGE